MPTRRPQAVQRHHRIGVPITGQHIAVFRRHVQFIPAVIGYHDAIVAGALHRHGFQSLEFPDPVVFVNQIIADVHNAGVQQHGLGCFAFGIAADFFAEQVFLGHHNKIIGFKAPPQRPHQKIDDPALLVGRLGPCVVAKHGLGVVVFKQGLHTVCTGGIQRGDNHALFAGKGGG